MCKTLRNFRKSMVLAFTVFASTVTYAQTQITDEAGLKAIANDLTGDYALANDITLSGEWTPIGTSNAPFKGKLKGNGKTIKGLTITSGNENVGLFAFTDGAVITDLHLTGAKIKGSKQAAILAGQSKSTTISSVFTSGIVTGIDHVGGIVGDARGDVSNGVMTTIQNCMSTAGVYSSQHQSGLIAGWTNAGTFVNNIAYGSVVSSDGTGGIVSMIDGNSSYGSFTGNVCAAAFLTGYKDRTHGICGWTNGTVTQSYDQNLSSAATIYTISGTVTDPSTLTGENQGTLATSDDLKNASTYTSIGFTSDAWNLSTGTYPVLNGMVTPIDGDAIYVNDSPEKAIIGTTFETGAVSALGRAVSISSSDPSVVSVDGTTLKFLKEGNSKITYTTVGDAFANGTTSEMNIAVSDINYAITVFVFVIN